MARNYGRIKVEIWETGSEFKRLQITAQWLYMMLVSQPTVTMIGTLVYTPRKWARNGGGLDESQLEGLVEVLEQERYILVDRHTDELLVRSFVKHDEPWRLPNLLTAARRQFRDVESDSIRVYLSERHPWLSDVKISRERVEEYEREHAHGDTHADTHSNTHGNTHAENAHSNTHSNGVLLADEASPHHHPTTSKGREGDGDTQAAAQEAAQPAQWRCDFSYSLGEGQVAECGVEFKDEVSLLEHRLNVHGLVPA